MALARASLKVLKADKELLMLPVLSGIATLAVAATFLVPLLAEANWEVSSQGSYVYWFFLYLLLAYITIFFNTALISAAHERLTGGDPTLGSALRGAARRAGRILPWAIISAVVSIVLRALEERAGFVGRIVVSLVGMAWAVVTFLVLPIIVVEGIGAGAAVKRSAELFRRTWGENLGAQFGMGMVGLLLMLPALAVGGLGLSLGGGISLVLVGIGVAWVMATAVVMAALSGIYQTALYHFAVGGATPGGFFESELLAEAFRPRKRRFGNRDGNRWFGSGGFVDQ